ncbi:MAG TPA: hypothetical protein VLV83_10465 [Acidobacteriota bacterium]|nr:hypothetical protein [Acidobacteriota bacterium]
MGIELEWFCLFALHLVGTSLFGVFEVETPWWRLMLKWLLIAGLVYLIYQWAGHWALAAIIIPALAGVTFHFIWCRKHAIHPLRALPRRKYYRLRGWDWVE